LARQPIRPLLLVTRREPYGVVNISNHLAAFAHQKGVSWH
jgi:hypothetical protein